MSGAAPEQRVRLRRRDDLAVYRRHYSGQDYWTIKDPLALRYYQLRDEEYFVLSALDGRVSLADLQRQFHERFAPRRIEVPQIHQFLGMLHRESLVIADAPEQGQRLLERRAAWRSRLRWERCANLLAVRFRGVDPEPLLCKLYPIVRWVFSAPMLLCGIALILSALLWSLVHWNELVSRLPTLGVFLHTGNLCWLAAALAMTKVLHELAHGLTCKHFGGSCRELGVMLLVLTPCLYCNVSDAWTFRSKWQRMAVSAAGIYAELLLAAAALFVWWYSAPGLLNSIALNIVVVSSVATVFFNGNPLLRYDGYFILADWLEIPNFGDQSRSLVRRRLLSLFGVDVAGSSLAVECYGWLQFAYGVASFCYRWTLVAVILWGVYSWLTAHRLHAVAQCVVAVVLAGMLSAPIRLSAKFWRDPAVRSQFRPIRGGFVAAAAIGVIFIALLTPLPSHVFAPGLLQTASRNTVYVSVGGQLTRTVAAGSRVTSGQVLAELEDLGLISEIATLRGERDVQQLRVRTLEQRLVHDPRDGIEGVGAQLPGARERLADLEDRLTRKREDAQRLTLRAPHGGVVFPPRRPEPVEDQATLEPWTGTPLDPENLGCFLERGTPFCTIGEPGKLEAVCYVGEDDIGWVQLGQAVQLRLPLAPQSNFVGRVTRVSAGPVHELPPEIVASGLLTAQSNDNSLQPASPLYEVGVELAELDDTLPIRVVSRGRISIGQRSLAARLVTFLRKTFLR